MAITSTAPVVSSTGISAPSFGDVLDFLVSGYKGIVGSDAYLDPSTQDGQWIAIQAQAIVDTNAAIIATYNSFSPATAVGAGLSSVVKINGIKRAVSSYSTVDLILSGTAGTTVTNGVVTDPSGNRWNLPATVNIPSGGSIVSTATAETIGAISVPANATWTINTPTLGWTGCTNSSASAPGNPVESDAALRNRQTSSVALPSLSILDGMIGALEDIPGVTRLQVYENASDTTDGSGLPPHSVTAVVEGGDSQTIANTIAFKKSPGVTTNGTTSETVTTAYSTSTISFYRPSTTSATVAITLKDMGGYTTAIGTAIKAAVSSYINALPIGKSVQLTKLYLPAFLSGTADSATYDITALTLNGASSDLTIGFSNVAYCDPSTGVTITVAS
jgi:uncharacterized phage protein gp47/JayE